MKTSRRLYYLDNLRVALMVGVITHHVALAYGPTGAWWPILEAAHARVLGPFLAVTRSFGMELFFMIAGYFTVMSCDAKGPRAFLAIRVLRLGVPLFIFALVMIPMQLFVVPPPAGQSRSAWPIDVGHMWFVEHLLIYSAAYALWCMIRPSYATSGQKQTTPPGHLSILIFALGLAAVSGVVRIWSPIDKWVHLLGFVRVALADVPRDLSFFIIGAVAYRRDWFSTFSRRAGLAWLLVGMGLVVLWYVYDLGLKAVWPIGDTAMDVIYPIWESVLCCGMCIGLTVLFREVFDTQSRLGKVMAQSQYAAYVFHVPFVLLFQYVVTGLALLPLVKFGLVTLVSVPATFLFSYAVRKPLSL
ncbi:MAG TPA: acyltransferase family protein [Anaerolineae bacterium]|nr:acyltransferase family protein [Anaerolineae bacterium]